MMGSGVRRRGRLLKRLELGKQLGSSPIPDNKENSAEATREANHSNGDSSVLEEPGLVSLANEDGGRYGGARTGGLYEGSFRQCRVLKEQEMEDVCI
jgi:hypothetical protein